MLIESKINLTEKHWARFNTYHITLQILNNHDYDRLAEYCRWFSPFQRVVVLFSNTVGTLTRDDVRTVTHWRKMTRRPQWRERLAWDDVRSLNSVVTREKHLHNLMVVILSGEYQWRYVRWKLTFLFSSEEWIILCSSSFDRLLACHVVGMFYHHFHYLCCTLYIGNHSSQCVSGSHTSRVYAGISLSQLFNIFPLCYFTLLKRSLIIVVHVQYRHLRSIFCCLTEEIFIGTSKTSFCF